MLNEVVENHTGANFAGRIEIPPTILEYRESSWFRRIICCWNMDPYLARRSRINRTVVQTNLVGLTHGHVRLNERRGTVLVRDVGLVEGERSVGDPRAHRGRA